MEPASVHHASDGARDFIHLLLAPSLPRPSIRPSIDCGLDVQSHARQRTSTHTLVCYGFESSAACDGADTSSSWCWNRRALAPQTAATSSRCSWSLHRVSSFDSFLATILFEHHEHEFELDSIRSSTRSQAIELELQVIVVGQATRQRRWRQEAEQLERHQAAPLTRPTRVAADIVLAGSAGYQRRNQPDLSGWHGTHHRLGGRRYLASYRRRARRIQVTTVAREWIATWRLCSRIVGDVHACIDLERGFGTHRRSTSQAGIFIGLDRDACDSTGARKPLRSC